MPPVNQLNSLKTPTEFANSQGSVQSGSAVLPASVIEAFVCLWADSLWQIGKLYIHADPRPSTQAPGQFWSLVFATSGKTSIPHSQRCCTYQNCLIIHRNYYLHDPVNIVRVSERNLDLLRQPWTGGRAYARVLCRKTAELHWGSGWL